MQSGISPAVRSLVLAGGASSRMGTDKALLSYHGTPQVHHLARMLQEVAPPAFVSVRQSQLGGAAFQELRLLPDAEEGIGPLAGLLAALNDRKLDSQGIVCASRENWRVA